MPKTLIIHDTFLYRGGGERLVLMMAKALEADIASGFFSEGSYNLGEQGFVGEKITLMPRCFLYTFSWLPASIAFVMRNGLRHFGLKWAFRWNTRTLSARYDAIIMSGDCLDAVSHFSDKKIIYYCHTVPRYLFDQREQYEQKVPKIILPLYRFLCHRFRLGYLRNLDQVSVLLTNSRNTQKRIRDFTGKEATILYPPVDTEFFLPSENYGLDLPSVRSEFMDDSHVLREVGPQVSIRTSLRPRMTGTYFLSFARLSAIKRVDRIVSAFQRMPTERLILTYGANDPEKTKIQNMIKDCPHIMMVQSPSDLELRALIQDARATIYVPVDEDFGMSPLESMSCGTPVIGVNEGGLRETIIDGKTGILIDPICSPDDIVEAVKRIQSSPLDPLMCRERAIQFSLEIFEEKLKKMIV